MTVPERNAVLFHAWYTTQILWKQLISVACLAALCALLLIMYTAVHWYLTVLVSCGLFGISVILLYIKMWKLHQYYNPTVPLNHLIKIYTDEISKWAYREVQKGWKPMNWKSL